jgi:REP element-mobilizing transposase RayT
MPNHVHGILVIVDASVGEKNVGANNAGAKNVGAKNVGAKNFSPLRSGQRPRGTSKTIGSVIRGFKIGVTKWMRQNTEFYHIWQRNYYEHIIRNENELNRIREYIANNPMKWEFDRENPDIKPDAKTICEPPHQYGNEPWQI